MKLYRKQLHSLEELKREKHVMKYAVKHTDDWLSFKEMSKGARPKDAATLGMLGSVISAVSSKSIFSTALTVVPAILNMMPRREAKKKKGILESLAKEVILGYVKWKAIQMSYRAIMMLINATKDKKEKEHR
ncbi:MAG TPA: hypothetical protein VL093_01470 [Flavipsychrobacter sp.]|jgi:hypothetical protein|nr:hypothetical protein [Flavipsychrobacter sp.]